MIIDFVAEESPNQLIAFIEHINRNPTGTYGLVTIKRDSLKPIQNNQFILKIESVLMDATKVKIFFIREDSIYIFWQGLVSQIYGQLKQFCLSHLIKLQGGGRPGSIAFIDPQIMANELCISLRGECTSKTNNESILNKLISSHQFEQTPEQQKLFETALQLRTLRTKPLFLVVDDQIFIRKILKDFLQKSYAAETAETLQEAWAMYLNSAPNVVFLDVELGDGNGHVLASHIKNIDPDAYVVMVTGNNHVSDVEIARLNKVDGFIAKPFNINNIRTALDRFLHTLPPLKQGTYT